MQCVERIPQFFGEPILDQGIGHLEIARIEEDSSRVDVAEIHRNFAGTFHH